MNRDNKSQLSGVDSENQDFRKYDQVTKDHRYRLSEHQDAEAFDDDYTIETCDLRLFLEGGEQGRAEFARKLGKALEGIGFAILSGHGIDVGLYEKGEQAVRSLFENTTRDQRLVYEAERHGSVNQGYFPIKKTTIIHPDLVEGWVFCRRAFDLDPLSPLNEPKFWPAPGYEPVFRSIVRAQEKLILPIMQSMLRHLGCDPHLYDQRLTDTNFGFRLNYYPPITDSQHESGAGRMLGHEDVDLFTFLPSQDVEGLQVFNRKNGKWIRLNAPKGTIVLNTGDYH